MDFQDCNYVSWNCKVIWYFLDVPGLFCVFPGVELDVSWGCTDFYWRCTGCFLEMYRISPGVVLMSVELKHNFTGVKLDWSKAGLE